MFYIEKLDGGAARISTEPPEGTSDYISLESLPEGGGCIRFDENGELYSGSFIYPPTPPEPDATDSDVIEILKILLGVEDDEQEPND